MPTPATIARHKRQAARNAARLAAINAESAALAAAYAARVTAACERPLTPTECERLAYAARNASDRTAYAIRAALAAGTIAPITDRGLRDRLAFIIGA